MQTKDEKKILNAKGFTINDEKYQAIKDKRWKKINEIHKVWYCEMHKTFFDPAEEPCWQCYDECVEEI